MRRVIIAFGLAAAVATATPALAAHNGPAKAKKFDITFVRAYLPCSGGSDTHNAPFPFPACAPVVASTDLAFDPLKGTCEAKGGVLLNSLKQATDVKLSAKCAGIIDTGTGLPFNGQVTTSGQVRITDINCTSGSDCTMIDVPLPVPMKCGTDASPPLGSGKCLVKTTANAAFGPPNSVVPGAAGNVEIQQLSIDHGGNLFAVGGMWLP